MASRKESAKNFGSETICGRWIGQSTCGYQCHLPDRRSEKSGVLAWRPSSLKTRLKKSARPLLKPFHCGKQFAVPSAVGVVATADVFAKKLK
jgi:hypothetical protein